MKVMITGTHFTPALAVIEELKKYKNLQIVYIGREVTMEGDPAKSVESEILPANGVKFIPLTVGRLQRSFTFYTIPSLIKIPIGFIQAFFVIFKEKPNVILSFGGYVAVPIVFMAWLFSIPVIIHEQTLVTGLANKICSIFADKIATSFQENDLNKNEKAILTGIPLRKEIIRGDIGRRFGNKPTVLITGGNQGSHVMNLAVEQCLEKLLRVANVIHQTGESKYKDFERLSKLENDRYQVYKWIDNMGEILKIVDLVVSRAGINTLSELAILGKPALVIPVPYLYQNEQNRNAKYFEKLGLVRILPQTHLISENLLKNITSCLNDLNHFNKRAQKAKDVIILDASKRLALETVLLGKSNLVNNVN